MAKRVPALVKHQLLVWARESAGLSLVDAADKLGIESDVLMDWEAGIEGPSIPQLRAMASLYKRPLSVFFLQEVPLKFQPLADFRRAGGGRYSAALTQEIRFATEHREVARELLADLGENPKKIAPLLRVDMPPEEAGIALREVLGFVVDKTNSFGSDREGRAALRAWRDRIESLGVLVFQTTRVDAEEASGFAIANEEIPVIVVNRKDPPTRRLFSLLHEFTHVMLGSSGVSDLKVDLSSSTAKRIELFCNASAAATLMPANILLNEEVVRNHEGDEAWLDSELSALSRKYGVSREALLLRLVNLQRASWAFYLEKRAQYLREYELYKDQAAQRQTEMKRNMPLEALSNYGRGFVGLVLGNYFQERLTLNEVSRVLDLKTRHIEPLHRLLVTTG